MRETILFKITPLLLFAFFILYPTYSFSQSSGSIGGKVTDTKDNSPLVGATVKIVGSNIGAVTDDDGNYLILNVDVGTYNIEASYIGYNSMRQIGIKISVDQRTKVNFELSVSGEITTGPIDVVAERKGIDVEQSGRIIESQQIKNSGTRGVMNIVSKTAGVVQDERGSSINIRGGRSNESIVIIDGVETTNPLDGSSRAFVPNNLLQEISVLTGGFGAEYGNVLSGVINVSTKSGSEKYTGSAEIITDELTGRYIDTKSQGYNLYNVSFGGPLIPTKNLSKVFNFFGSVERTFERIAIASWITDKLPTIVPNGELKDDETGNWSYNGRLNLNFSELKGGKIPINLKFGTSVNLNRSRSFYGGNVWQNSDRNPIVETDDYQYFARIIHNVSSKFFYEAQVSYFKTYSEQSDQYFGDNLTYYGDTNHVPGLNAYYQSAGTTNAMGKQLTSDPNTSYLYYMKNYVIDYYSKTDVSYIGTKFDGTWALLNKKIGDHEIKFGGEYKYHTLKRESVYPIVLSDLTISSALDRWYSTNEGRLKSYGYRIVDPYTGTLIADGNDAKHPITGGFYVRDKVSFSDFNFNGGLRVDFLDVNTKVWKDLEHDITGADGIIASDDDFVDSKTNWSVSPRLGFSFPVTDKTIFHAQYGKMVQMPQLTLLYVSQETMRRFLSTSLQDVIENSALTPSKLTQYEIGLKHQIGDLIDLGATAFYKESTDLVGAARIKATDDGKVPVGFVTYKNTDFAISRGVDFYLSLRRTNRLSVNLAYTLAWATGTGSDAYSKTSLANNSSEEMPLYVYALDYDQRHTGSVNLDYRFGDNDVPKGFLGSVLKNMGFNIDFSFNSGRPYTKREVSQTATGTGGDIIYSTKNGVYRGWNYEIDLKVDKSVIIFKSNFNFYIYVINLLNTEIINNVFSGTGTPDDNGFLQTATGASKWENDATFRKLWPERIKFFTNWGTPRQVRFGLNVSF
jgi:outer membrane receptor protein involved in Fe transport